jgi:hypothetical protein
MNPFQELKAQLKDWSLKIRNLKRSRKQDKRGTTPLWQIEGEIYSLKRTFRHHHIVYCEVRGRTRDQIEKPSENNLPDETKIQKIKEEFLKKVKEYETLYPRPQRPDSIPASGSSGTCVSGIPT